MTWLIFERPVAPLPAQGWKVHVSAGAGECVRLLKRIGWYLLDQQATFKIPACQADYAVINGGDLGLANLGKIVTVYPRDAADAARLAHGLDGLWRSARGPAVPSDLALSRGSSISLRYGAFRAAELVATDGSVEADVRSTDGSQPSWTVPPLPALAPARRLIKNVLRVAGVPYTVVATMRASARGAVYLCVDAGIEPVIVKLRYRGITRSLTNRRVRPAAREFGFLSRLRAAYPWCPRPIALELGEPDMLAMADVGGAPLSDLPRPDQRRALVTLCRNVSSLHALGIVHRDIKLRNALGRGDAVMLVDFEHAADIGDGAPLPGGSRGHIAPEQGRPAHPAVDVFALGMCLAHVTSGVDPELCDDAPSVFVERIIASGLARHAALVGHATHPCPNQRPSAAALCDAIADLLAT